MERFHGWQKVLMEQPKKSLNVNNSRYFWQYGIWLVDWFWIRETEGAWLHSQTFRASAEMVRTLGSAGIIQKRASCFSVFGVVYALWSAASHKSLNIPKHFRERQHVWILNILISLMSCSYGSFMSKSLFKIKLLYWMFKSLKHPLNLSLHKRFFI